jgi:integrase
MAGVQQRGSGFRVIYRYHGKQHTLRLGKVSEQEAQGKAAQVDYLLMRLRQGLIHVPPSSTLKQFLESDGNPPAKPGGVPTEAHRAITLGELRDRYLRTHKDSLEDRTLDTMRLHFKHLCAALGERFFVHELTLADLQDYVNARAKASGRTHSRLSGTTIREEVVSLRKAWNWGLKMKLVQGRYPYEGLRYPKTDEKPPFQTRQEIERRISIGGITPEQTAQLWECLYFQVYEIADLLAFLKQAHDHAWIYPLVCMAAHTGARRSELLRSEVADVDFEGGTLLIRERKRIKGKRSTRRAPLTPQLREALLSWLEVHPGGPALFCHAGEVPRSKKRSSTTGHRHGDSRPTTLKGRLATVRKRGTPPSPTPLTASECHHHVKRLLRRSPQWSVVRGLHVLRHSFISGLAAAGVDQRVIDDIVGHTTEEMRRRYRHLTPQVKSNAVLAVFGKHGSTAPSRSAGAVAG